MNNKGFTLIELLAVIVILLSVSLVSVYGISSSLNKRDIKERNEEIELAKNAAKIYFSLDGLYESKVTIEKLKEKNYLKEKTDKLDDDAEISIENGIITYCSITYSGTECS